MRPLHQRWGLHGKPMVNTDLSCPSFNCQIMEICLWIVTAFHSAFPLMWIIIMVFYNLLYWDLKLMGRWGHLLTPSCVNTPMDSLSNPITFIPPVLMFLLNQFSTRCLYGESTLPNMQITFEVLLPMLFVDAYAKDSTFTLNFYIN